MESTVFAKTATLGNYILKLLWKSSFDVWQIASFSIGCQRWPLQSRGYVDRFIEIIWTHQKRIFGNKRCQQGK